MGGRQPPVRAPQSRERGGLLTFMAPSAAAVPPGTKGRGKKGSRLWLAPRCAGPAKGPGICRRRQPCTAKQPWLGEWAQSAGTLWGTQCMYQFLLEGDYLDFNVRGSVGSMNLNTFPRQILQTRHLF